MRVKQHQWKEGKGWDPKLPSILGPAAQWVLAFGATSRLRDPLLLEQLRGAYPQAHVMGCSTAGEIYGTRVEDDTMVATAVQFEHTEIKGVEIDIQKISNSFEVGKQLAQALCSTGLIHVFVISDGQKVNGSELVKGLVAHLPPGVTITGGLAGDGANFQQTLVSLDGPAKEGCIAALGFYGPHVKIGCASMGGWDTFGPERCITKSKANVLYEVDGQPALDLYKKYLGDAAAGLPSTGLLFPLSLRVDGSESGLVRTILAVSENEKSMTFAGDVPEGSYARLMKANFDRLVEGATQSARLSQEGNSPSSPELAILISCVGRKLILKQRIEEEVETVRDVLGKETALTGFYSYGEISPFTPKAKCELHNQTMTITTFTEK